LFLPARIQLRLSCSFPPGLRAAAAPAVTSRGITSEVLATRVCNVEEEFITEVNGLLSSINILFFIVSKYKSCHDAIQSSITTLTW